MLVKAAASLTPDATASAVKTRPRGRPVSAQKGSAILAAATTEFGRSGYRDASMDQIAAKAGVSKRTLYSRFANKEALFHAVIGEAIVKVSVQANLIYEPATSLRLQLRRYAEASIKLNYEPENLKLFRAIMIEQLRSPGMVNAALGSYWKNEYGFVNWVKAAVKDGRLKSVNAVRTSHLFASMIRGVILWPALFDRHRSESKHLNPTIDEAIDMFLAHAAVRP